MSGGDDVKLDNSQSYDETSFEKEEESRGEMSSEKVEEASPSPSQVPEAEQRPPTETVEAPPQVAPEEVAAESESRREDPPPDTQAAPQVAPEEVAVESESRREDPPLPPDTQAAPQVAPEEVAVESESRGEDPPPLPPDTQDNLLIKKHPVDEMKEEMAKAARQEQIETTPDVEMERRQEEEKEKTAQETAQSQPPQDNNVVEASSEQKAQQVAEIQAAEFRELVLQAVRSLDKAQIQELKAFATPPEQVKLVFEAVMHLQAIVANPSVGRDQKECVKDTSWKGAQKMLADMQFDEHMKALATMPLDRMLADEKSSVHQNIARAREVQDSMGDDFSYGAMRSKSLAASNFVIYVDNFIKYYDASMAAIGKKAPVFPRNKPMSGSAMQKDSLDVAIEESSNREQSPQQSKSMVNLRVGDHKDLKERTAFHSQTVDGVMKRTTFMHALSTYPTSPQVSIASRTETTMPRSNQGPAPGSYNLPHDEKSKFKATAKYSFGGGTRFGLGDSPTKKQPGPGAYNPKDPSLNSDTKVGFGTSVRGKSNSAAQANPGPGAYENRSTVGGGLMFTARGRHPTSYMRSRSLPGPGAYTPALGAAYQTSPKCGFGTSTRGEFGGAVRGMPGPGTYEMQNFKCMGKDSKKFSATSRRRMHDLNSYVTPGPGTYNSHCTSFGIPGASSCDHVDTQYKERDAMFKAQANKTA